MDDGHEDCSDAVDDGHEDAADGAEHRDDLEGVSQPDTLIYTKMSRSLTQDTTAPIVAVVCVIEVVWFVMCLDLGIGVYDVGMQVNPKM